MRRAGLGLMVLLALALPAAASAAAPTGTPHSGISGTLLDSTCGTPTACVPPCPPPCRGNIVCAQPQLIACPQRQMATTAICLSSGCGFTYPPYEGDGATITVRRAGSDRILRTVTPNEGRFSIPLGAGRYVLRGYVALPCWSGEKVLVTVQPGHWTTGAAVLVHDGCVVHTDATG